MKVRVTVPLRGKATETPAQKHSDAENVSNWLSHNWVVFHRSPVDSPQLLPLMRSFDDFCITLKSCGTNKHQPFGDMSCHDAHVASFVWCKAEVGYVPDIIHSLGISSCHIITTQYLISARRENDDYLLNLWFLRIFFILVWKVFRRKLYKVHSLEYHSRYINSG